MAKGNAIQKLLAAKTAVMAKGALRIGVDVGAISKLEKEGWKRVN